MPLHHSIRLPVHSRTPFLMQASFQSLAALLAVITTLALPAHAAVPGMKVLKLFSPHPMAEGAFGNACAMTDRYAIVGEPGYSSTITGAVHVFNAATGALVRTVKPTVSAAGDGFGNGLAVDGTRMLVWASPGGTGSSVYLMDLTTGKELRKFVPGAGQDDFFFGWSMILTERQAIIANPNDATSKGAVYIFNLATNDPPQKLTPPDGASNDFFGAAMNLQGSVLIVGSPKNGGKGAVYRFNIESAQFLSKIQPAGLGAGDRFGDRITGWGASAFVSAHQQDTAAGTNAGSVYAVSMEGTFDAMPFSLDPTPGMDRYFGWLARQEGNLVVWGAGKNYVVADAAHRSVRKVIPTEQLDNTLWPDGSALAGNRLLLSYAFDSTYGLEAGAACLVQLLPEPLGGQTVASKGDSAPGAANIVFGDLSTAAINGDGRVVVATSLSGAGSNAGKDKAVFDDLAAASVLDLASKSRDDAGTGVKIGTLSSPFMNNAHALFQATLTGTGVTALNNRIIVRDDGTAPASLLRTGATLGTFGGAALQTWGALAQSSVNPEFVSILTLRKGVAGTSAINDSALAVLNSTTGAIAGQERENADSPVSGIKFGQFVRASFQYDTVAYSAMLSGPAAQNQGFFTKKMGNASNLVMRKGGDAIGITGAIVSAFLGEAVNASGRTVLRAKISGTGITPATNEVIWQQIGMMLSPVARTGSLAPGQPVGGAVWNRFTQIVPQNDRTIIRGQLRGTGVTAANDEIVSLLQEDGSFLVLLREGDALPGCNGAKVGAIVRLEVAPTGQYRALVTLTGTGVTAASNLALIGGSTVTGTTTSSSSLRKPWLLLRKGALVSLNSLAAPVRVLSLSFAHSGSLDTAGMGCKGLPAVTGAGGTLVKATVTGKFTHLLKLE